MKPLTVLDTTGFLTRDEAAERLGIVTRTLHMLRKSGELRWVRIAGRVLVVAADVDAPIAKNQARLDATLSATVRSSR